MPGEQTERPNLETEADDLAETTESSLSPTLIEAKAIIFARSEELGLNPMQTTCWYEFAHNNYIENTRNNGKSQARTLLFKQINEYTTEQEAQGISFLHVAHGAIKHFSGRQSDGGARWKDVPNTTTKEQILRLISEKLEIFIANNCMDYIQEKLQRDIRRFSFDFGDQISELKIKGYKKSGYFKNFNIQIDVDASKRDQAGNIIIEYHAYPDNEVRKLGLHSEYEPPSSTTNSNELTR